MQHLKETHGSFDMPASLVIGRDLYGNQDCSFEKFHEFPKQWGWSILEDYRLQTTTPPRLDFWQFLQSWLFFGLVYTVVQENQQPILTFEVLTQGTATRRGEVTTKKLNGALDKWHRHVIGLSQTNPDAARMLMVRVEEVLKLAKKVVYRNLAITEDHGPKPLYLTSNFTEDSERIETEDSLALSLMILGETLEARKAAIIRAGKLEISGWLEDATNEGWGPSNHVLGLMKKKEWCPRTISILRSQLQSHATLMLAAFLSHKDTNQETEHAQHNRTAPEKCTDKECKFKSQMLGTGRYATKHTSTCADHTKCENRGKKGPDMGRILDILKDEQIPTVNLTRAEDGGFHFQVNPHPRRPRNPADAPSYNAPQYATISHVWSDGWGNEESNELYHCQLLFVYRLLWSGMDLAGIATRNGSSTANDSPISFWMDTLVIPVSKDPTVREVMRDRGISKESFKASKKEAISQIHDVFFDSEFTVVIDNALYERVSDKYPCRIAMKILASGWMKRLWTLQEAFLSRRIFVALGGGLGDDSPVIDFDTLIDDDLRHSSEVANPLPLLTKRHLTESLIHNYRYRAVDQRRIAPATRAIVPDEVSSGRYLEGAIKGYTLITSVWRAARWRTTSNPAHETLALATLLHLDYSQTIIGAAGLAQPSSRRMDKNETRDSDARVMEFWNLFHEERPGSIPAGLIFLPGPRVAIKGYGWAPRSFLDVFQARREYPDPFPPAEPRTFFPTRIDKDRGRCVRYPGFMLHCKNAQRVRKIIGSDKADQEPSLVFPANGSYLEWYSVKPADSLPTNRSAFQKILARRTQLAIILTRPVSRNMIAEEIGLLVEIYKTNETRRPDGTSQRSYCCQIVRRVMVKRDLSRSRLPHLPSSHAPAAAESGVEGAQAHTASRSLTSIYGPNAPPQLQLMPETLRPAEMPPEGEDEICIGEALDTNQEWYVDGFQSSRDDDLPHFRAPRVEAPTTWRDKLRMTAFLYFNRTITPDGTSGLDSDSAPSPSTNRLPRSSTSLSSGTTSPEQRLGMPRSRTFSALTFLPK